MLIGPAPEPIWQRWSADARSITEAIYTDISLDPAHAQPTRRHFVVELIINSQLRETRVFHTKQQALTQGMAWFRQYESPYHRLAMRLHVPDAIAARGTLGVQLPKNGQSLTCELFAFHNGHRWQILLNADGRPLFTREYRTEEAACLDAWGLAWKLQGHALPWPAHWLPTPPIVRKAMARYDRIPTLSPAQPLAAAANRPAIAGSALSPDHGEEDEVEAESVEEPSELTGADLLDDLTEETNIVNAFRLLHFATTPRESARRRRWLHDF